MALQFTPAPPASGDALRLGSAIISDYPFTIAAWIKPDVNDADQMVAAIQKKTASNQYFQLLLTSGAKVRFSANAGSGPADTESTGTFAAGDWIHVAAVANSNAGQQLRTVYLNGARGLIPSADTVSPVGLDRTSFGARQDLVIGAWLDGALGYIATGTPRSATARSCR